VSQAKLACGRVGDDVDGMAVRSGRPALRLLTGPAACVAASWCICMTWGIVPPMHYGGGARASGSRRVSWPTPQSKAGGARARQRLVGGNPSCGELVGDAAN
jgi:hypothetical protein